MQRTEKALLKQLDNTLLTAADHLRPSFDAVDFIHIVLGLLILSIISDSGVVHKDEQKTGLGLRGAYRIVDRNCAR